MMQAYRQGACPIQLCRNNRSRVRSRGRSRRAESFCAKDSWWRGSAASLSNRVLCGVIVKGLRTDDATTPR